MLLAKIDDELFQYEHLFASPNNLEEIKSFTVVQPTGKGLERYLKLMAEQEEYNGGNRTLSCPRQGNKRNRRIFFSAHRFIHAQRPQSER